MPSINQVPENASTKRKLSEIEPEPDSTPGTKCQKQSLDVQDVRTPQMQLFCDWRIKHMADTLHLINFDCCTNISDKMSKFRVGFAEISTALRLWPHQTYERPDELTKGQSNAVLIRFLGNIDEKLEQLLHVAANDNPHSCIFKNKCSIMMRTQIQLYNDANTFIVSSKDIVSQPKFDKIQNCIVLLMNFVSKFVTSVLA